jgi:hypothetical protein
MSEAKPLERFLLTGYTVQVYAGEDSMNRDLNRVAEAVDDELHDQLFLVARRLERLFGVHVVAIDEEGTGWIAGGLGKRPSRR